MLLKEIQQGENKKLEFKERMPSGEAIAKIIVAFSNTAGGKLVIGVNKKREVVGINEDKVFEYEEKITSIINDLCYPTILPEIYIQNLKGKVVLVVEVFRGSLLPYYLKNKGKLHGTYIRVGSTNRLADENIIAELQRQRVNKSFDEEVNFENDLEQINLDVMYNEFKKIGKKFSKEKLVNLKLVKRLNNKNVPTNALLIVLGMLGNTEIKCARFKGTTKDVFVDKKEFDEDLFSNLHNTINFLKNHLNLHAKVKDLQREEDYEIPLVALREAVLNAIVHRDYTRSSDIKVAIYDDLVEIVSPGGFPNGLTLEDVLNGRSELRNKVIAGLFKELRYIESWGSGIGKIKNLCQKRGIDFRIEENFNFTAIVFERKIDKTMTSNAEKVPKNRRKSAEKMPKNVVLSHQEEKIILFVKENLKIDVKSVENLLRVKERRAREILSGLVKKGILDKKGKTKGSYYILKE